MGNGLQLVGFKGLKPLMYKNGKFFTGHSAIEEGATIYDMVINSKMIMNDYDYGRYLNPGYKYYHGLFSDLVARYGIEYSIDLGYEEFWSKVFQQEFGIVFDYKYVPVIERVLEQEMLGTDDLQFRGVWDISELHEFLLKLRMGAMGPE